MKSETLIAGNDRKCRAYDKVFLAFKMMIHHVACKIAITQTL